MNLPGSSPGQFVPDGPLLEALDRHRSGDFGDLGRFDDAPDVNDDDVRWCPGAFPILSRIALAIRDGSGTVMSRHRVDSPKSGMVDVSILTGLTNLGEGMNRTLILPAQKLAFSPDPGLPPVEPQAPASPRFGPTDRGPTWPTGMLAR